MMIYRLMITFPNGSKSQYTLHRAYNNYFRYASFEKNLLPISRTHLCAIRNKMRQNDDAIAATLSTRGARVEVQRTEMLATDMLASVYPDGIYSAYPGSLYIDETQRFFAEPNWLF